MMDCFRFAGTGESPQSKKSCKEVRFLVFAIRGLPSGADFAKDAWALGDRMGESAKEGASNACLRGIVCIKNKASHCCEALLYWLVAPRSVGVSAVGAAGA